MRLLKWITENPWIGLLVSLILIVTSAQDVWSDLREDMSAFQVGSHHGVLVFGIYNLIKTLPNLVQSIQAVEENLEKVERK